MGTRGKFGGSREKWCFAAFSQHFCARDRGNGDVLFTYETEKRRLGKKKES